MSKLIFSRANNVQIINYNIDETGDVPEASAKIGIFSDDKLVASFSVSTVSKKPMSIDFELNVISTIKLKEESHPEDVKSQKNIPVTMMEGIQCYIQKQCRPGTFLQAIIENDLKTAVVMADHINIRIIPAYVNYFYNNAPKDCWGHKGVIEEWFSKGEEVELD